jgi:ribose-phosphate pyrophosphokinase
MTAILFALPGNEAMTDRLALAFGGELGRLELRRFPDEEMHLRFANPLCGKRVLLVCTLDRPDAKFLTLAFAAATAREMGAKDVILVSPYLAYMRQDRHFEPGDADSAPIFAKLVAQSFDGLVTIDPHLHRVHRLRDIYEIPAVAMHAAPLLSQWIANNVADAVLIGPDEESSQWVEAVAKAAGAPFTVLAKTRRGDRDVEVSMPDMEHWHTRTPVLVDDIISTGRTMAETLRLLSRAGMKPATCLGVHAVFAPGAYEDLRAAGAGRIVTTNTILHETNAIDASGLLAEGLRLLPKEGA